MENQPLQTQVQNPMSSSDPTLVSASATKPNWLLLVLITLVLGLLISTISLFYQNQQLKKSAGNKLPSMPSIISSYEECLKTPGSLIQESYPAVCVAPGGAKFTQIVSPLNNTVAPSSVPEISPSPTPVSLVPANWKVHTFAKYGLTLYAPAQWQSSVQDYPENSESLIRFWQGNGPDTATIQLDIKTSWANTGDAPYQPKNYTVAGDIAAVKVDPPQKNERTLDRYQTNVYFEHGTKTYVFTCVHNWIPEQYQLCDTMLKTLQFTQ